MENRIIFRVNFYHLKLGVLKVKRKKDDKVENFVTPIPSFAEVWISYSSNWDIKKYYDIRSITFVLFPKDEFYPHHQVTKKKTSKRVNTS